MGLQQVQPAEGCGGGLLWRASMAPAPETASAAAPPHSLKLSWCKRRRCHDKVVIRVHMHRIPPKCISVDVGAESVKITSVRHSKRLALDLPYPDTVAAVDEDGAVAEQAYGILTVLIPIKTPGEEEEEQDRKAQRKRQRKAKKVESARAAAIANMAGVDAADVPRRGREPPTRREPVELEEQAAAAGSDESEPQAEGSAVTGGQWAELWEQYQLVKGELDGEERAEAEAELAEIRQMEMDPTGRGGAEGGMASPKSKKKRKRKRKRGGEDSKAEAELTGALAMAEEVAARQDDAAGAMATAAARKLAYAFLGRAGPDPLFVSLFSTPN